MDRVIKIIVTICIVCSGCNAIAETKFIEVVEPDDSIVVQKWTHDAEKDFITEAAPIKLEAKEKEKVWKGEAVVRLVEEIKVLSLFFPEFERLTFERLITWSEGKYNIVDGKIQTVVASNRLLIILLCVITFGMLLWDVVLVKLFIRNGYDRDTAFGVSFIDNALIFIMGPIGIGIAAIILRIALQSVEGSLLREFLKPIGVIWLVCFPLIISWICLFTKSMGIISRQMDGNAEGVRSVWSKIFLTVLMVIINVSIAVITTIAIFDLILIEWILYLVMCFTCLPMSIALAGVTINSLKAR